MGASKSAAKKIRLISISKVKDAPRWADLRKYGKRARSRRIRIHGRKNWKRNRTKAR
ncbi:MAG: hypothetical protein QXU82_03580 [Candidatus Aenigmatarchaeota archaeon]